MTREIDEIIQAAVALLRSCAEIDHYYYHDVPSSPTHDQDTEDRLRAALAAFDVDENFARRGW